MNKTILTIVTLLIIVLAGGLYAINVLDPERVNEPTPNAVETPASNDDNAETSTVYRDAEVGLSFEYPTGVQGYNLVATTPSGEDHVKSITLIHAQDQVSESNPEVPREGPPAITIAVYRNDDNMWAQTWVDAHPELSNINTAFAEPQDEVIGGAHALRYITDGLYAADTAVIAHGSFIYVVSGAYIDENSPTRTDFEPILDSITFIPEE